MGAGEEQEKETILQGSGGGGIRLSNTGESRRGSGYSDSLLFETNE